MGIHVGIDLGSISCKLALLLNGEDRTRFADKVDDHRQFDKVFADDELAIYAYPYRRIVGNPLENTVNTLTVLLDLFEADQITSVSTTGSGGRLLADHFHCSFSSEFKAIAKSSARLYPDIQTILEIGGANSKYLRLNKDPKNGQTRIVDYEKNGECAAGTGSFLDQQANRLLFNVEDIGERSLTADKSARIAGRCSVFAKSDMIHAQQKGYKPEEIMMGLCEGVVRNFKSSILKGKQIIPKVLFIGGVAQNAAVVKAMQKIFDLDREELFVPKACCWIGAIGAALISIEHGNEMTHPDKLGLYESIERTIKKYPTHDPLNLDEVILLRDRIDTVDLSGYEFPIPSFLGIDIGSVSTNLVLTDQNGTVLKEIYLKTKGRPIATVNEGLKEIENGFADKVTIMGVGTTGSGRELIGELVGADVIIDEITAHKTGSHFICEKMDTGPVDTIFEIGGQDSKFISISDGVVVDFTMNEACAAGTGSFLEEQAERLNIQIKDEFAEIALSAKHPIILGERCTVFMENDLISWQQKGIAKADLIAGLAYSIAQNYLNRVVKGRPIGKVIYFQGGTAYNNAVAAAFSAIVGKKIIVPPYNGVIGALGVALLTMEKCDSIEDPAFDTKFRGYDIEAVDYRLREFACNGCSNGCDIQQFTVEGTKTYWGDKCSDRYRKRAKTEQKPVIPDLIKWREELLLSEYKPDRFPGRPTIGIPRAMYFYDYFPFWDAMFGELGFNVKISETTNKKIVNTGIELTVAEPCFPLKIAHGHVESLINDPKVDYVFLPNMMDAENEDKELQSHFCPWGQTLPWVVRNVSQFRNKSLKFLTPTLHFRLGREMVIKEHAGYFRETLGLSADQVTRAVDAGYRKWRELKREIQAKGLACLSILEKEKMSAVVLLGRLYNIYDLSANIAIAQKLRDNYGINVLPLDFLPVDQLSIDPINDNMFWNYGKKILRTAVFTKYHTHLHAIYITNFKCGPDSFVKHFIRDAGEKPFLTLQYDEHSNDAGMITRCEAYLNSKGIISTVGRSGTMVVKEKQMSLSCTMSIHAFDSGAAKQDNETRTKQ